MTRNTGSAAVALSAMPESAGSSSTTSMSFADRSERELRDARAAADAAARALRALPADASPLAIAAAADALVKHAGEVWMHAHRVAEARSTP